MKLTADNRKCRKIKSALASASLRFGVLVIAPLGLVFFYLLVNGAGSVNLDFFTKLPSRSEPGGGMANAIVGTLELLAIAGDRDADRRIRRRLPRRIRLRPNQFCAAFIADVLNGVPSITWGVVVYGLVVFRFKGFSGYAGGLALVLIMIPLILRTTEEVIFSCQRLSRSGARAWHQPLENNRAHRDEDRVQGDRYRGSARTGSGRRRNGAAAFYRLRQSILESQTSNRSRRCRCKFSPMQFLLTTIGIARPGRRARARHRYFCVNVLVRILTRRRGATIVFEQ